jgi:antitoxin HicB
MCTYPVEATEDDNGTILVRFPDIPEAITVAYTSADIPRVGKEALLSAFKLYTDSGRSIPRPSPTCPGQFSIEVPTVAMYRPLRRA